MYFTTEPIHRIAAVNFRGVFSGIDDQVDGNSMGENRNIGVGLGALIHSSLNLGCAVQVLSYELRMAHLQARDGQLPKYDDWDVPLATSQAQEHFFEHLQQTLEQLAFLQPDNPRQTMTRLRRLYSRVRMDEMELNILRGMLTATQNHVHHADGKIAALEAQLAARGDAE